MVVEIRLTEQQRAALADLFEEVDRLAAAGTPGAMMAQIFSRSARVCLVSPERGRALQAVIGIEVGSLRSDSDRESRDG